MGEGFTFGFELAKPFLNALYRPQWPIEGVVLLYEGTATGAEVSTGVRINFLN